MPSSATRLPTAPFPPPGWAGVSTCALERTANHRDGGHLPWQPDFQVLLLVTAGHGAIEVDFVRYACRPGTLLWVRPGQELRIGPDSLEASVVTFEQALADEQPPETGDLSHWQLAGEDEDAVISEFAQLAVDCERHTSGPVAAQLLRHQVAVLLLRLALRSGAAPQGAEARTFVRFRRLLEDGHPRSRRVEDYADELGCSVRTLTRACLAVTGRTAKQVVDDRVSLQARRLLTCTPLSVAEIGRVLGFPEPTNFGRFFHREVGVSPGQFRTDALPDGLRRIPVQRPAPDGG